MQTKTKDWVLGVLIAICIIVVCGLLDDTPTQQQIAAQEVKEAQLQARVEQAEHRRQLKIREIEAAHMLALDQIKP